MKLDYCGFRRRALSIDNKRSDFTMILNKRMVLGQIITSIQQMSGANCENLCSVASFKKMEKGDILVHQGFEDRFEYFLLNGKCRNLIRDARGREVTLGFTKGLGIVPPNIARTRDGNSLVEIEMLAKSEIGAIDSNKLTELMVEDAEIREWGNTVMRQELQRMVAREWSLAALSAQEKLEWFRSDFPDGEATFPHVHIASYLGITPVTLSRARKRS
jgi:CRP-like cAMP-binding protein